MLDFLSEVFTDLCKPKGSSWSDIHIVSEICAIIFYIFGKEEG